MDLDNITAGQDGPQIGDVVMLFRFADPENTTASPMALQQAVLAALRQAGLLPTKNPQQDAMDIKEFKERATLAKPQVRRLGRSGWNS